MESTTGALPDLDQASLPFVGRWDRLVSQTNWEKGQIILDWRRELQGAGAPTSEFSDEAWANRVSGVTGQHVGRLRRVAERFGAGHSQFQGLYWSHFQAAIDWSDAEMWLEGAVQSGWSVAAMREQRSKTMGELAASPVADESPPIELDEDFTPEAGATATKVVAVEDEVRDDDSSEAADDDRADQDACQSAADETDSAARDSDRPAAPVVRPFADLPQLPDDVSEAFESMKLAILRHKSSGWKEIARDDIVAVLRALEELALAASGEEAPF